jgi:hypothetical protein
LLPPGWRHVNCERKVVVPVDAKKKMGQGEGEGGGGGGARAPDIIRVILYIIRVKAHSGK